MIIFRVYLVLGFAFCSAAFAQEKPIPWDGGVSQSGDNYILSDDGARLQVKNSDVVLKDGQ
jgi:hypothetical protein